MKKPVMRNYRSVCVILFAVALLLLLAGCGGNGSTPTFNISGNWNITWTPASSPGGTYVFSFSQSVDSLSGTTSQGQPLAGSISGQNVQFSFIWIEDPSGVQNTYTFNGTEGPNGATMTGTWTNGGGASGTWSGAFIPK